MQQAGCGETSLSPGNAAGNTCAFAAGGGRSHSQGPLLHAQRQQDDGGGALPVPLLLRQPTLRAGAGSHVHGSSCSSCCTRALLGAALGGHERVCALLLAYGGRVRGDCVAGAVEGAVVARRLAQAAGLSTVGLEQAGKTQAPAVGPPAMRSPAMKSFASGSSAVGLPSGRSPADETPAIAGLGLAPDVTGAAGGGEASAGAASARAAAAARRYTRICSMLLAAAAADASPARSCEQGAAAAIVGASTAGAAAAATVNRGMGALHGIAPPAAQPEVLCSMTHPPLDSTHPPQGPTVRPCHDPVHEHSGLPLVGTGLAPAGLPPHMPPHHLAFLPDVPEPHQDPALHQPQQSGPSCPAVRPQPSALDIDLAPALAVAASHGATDLCALLLAHMPFAHPAADLGAALCSAAQQVRAAGVPRICGAWLVCRVCVPWTGARGVRGVAPWLKGCAWHAAGVPRACRGLLCVWHAEHVCLEGRADKIILFMCKGSGQGRMFDLRKAGLLLVERVQRGGS